MLSRGAARLVTGPLAFLVAGLIDLAAFGGPFLWQVARRRLRHRITAGAPAQPPVYH